MNINRQLFEAANLNPTKNSRQEYIFTLCEYIEKNELYELSACDHCDFCDHFCDCDSAGSW